MARGSLNFVALCSVILAISSSEALISTADLNSPYPKAISDLKNVIVKGLGFQAEDFKVSGFDLREALVGQSVAYEFDVEIDNKIIPLKLLEDANRWEYVDLPIFRQEMKIGGENGLVERRNMQKQLPVLEPFQLAGPMELWIQDGKDMRISLPHDVDAGELKKVILADGAVVTVKGARSVSLRHPIELPLPLNRTQNSFASALLSLADRLRHASLSSDSSLLSLRIVGPTSLTSPATSSKKLKLKRIAPGLVELSSPKKTKAIDLEREQEATALLTPTHFTTLWPLTNINGTNANLRGFESLLSSVLGKKAYEKGTFKLLKADVSAKTFVKIGFGVEKKLKENDGIIDFKNIPEWRTKPENVMMHFEVLAKIEGDKVIPERVVQVNPVIIEDTTAQNLLTGNRTMSNIPIVHPPSDPFTL